MKILLIVFTILFLINKIWANYYKNNLIANIKLYQRGNILFAISIMSEYILGAIIIIKVILKLIGE